MKRFSVAMLFLVCALDGKAANGVIADPDTSKLEAQAEAMEKNVKRNERARKMLELRLSEFLKEIETLPTTSPELPRMSRVAISGQAAVKKLKAEAEKADKLKQEISSFTLASKALPSPTLPPADSVRKEETDPSNIAKRRKQQKADVDAAREILEGYMLALENEKDSQSQKTILAQIHIAAKDVEKKEETLKDTTGELIEIANASVKPPLAAEIAATLFSKITRLDVDSDKTLAEANDVMADMRTPTERSLVSIWPWLDYDKNADIKFLNFLESHPLLESEVSGPGLQISTTSGNGKITLKPEFLWGRKARFWTAVSISSPISKDSDSRMSAVRNSVVLDKLAGDTTIKIEANVLKPGRENKNFFLLGGSAEVGYQEFSYLDPVKTFADPSDPKRFSSHETSYALSAHAGYSPQDYNDLFLIRYSRQFSHVSNPGVTACPPLMTNALYVECVNGSFNPPKGKKFNIYSVEWRHRFDSFAFSTLLSYDRSSKVRGIAIPVYLSLLNDGRGVFGSVVPQMSAGVQFGWRSDTKASVGVFAGIPFTMSRSE